MTGKSDFGISAAGRKRIAAAQRARWAKVKADKTWFTLRRFDFYFLRLMRPPTDEDADVELAWNACFNNSGRDFTCEHTATVR
jgi:hypothetical protein